MLLIAVGKLGRGPERALFDRYAARLHPPLVMKEVADGAGAPLEAKRREGAALLAALPAASIAVALDLGGLAPDSAAFARMLQGWLSQSRPLAFLVGGPDGLERAVLDRVDAQLSLGPLTWPHLLVRVMLAEQLFRAQSILAGHPYHRPCRPDRGR